MKPQTAQFLQSVIFCALLIAAITGVYLYAGARDGAAEDAALFSALLEDGAPEAASADAGRETDASVGDAGSAPQAANASARTEQFLRKLAEAGYTFSEAKDEGYTVAKRADGSRVCTLLPAEQDGAVTGATAVFPYRMEGKLSASAKKNQSAIEAALAARDTKARTETAAALRKFLPALFDALDRADRLPSTVRLRWLAAAEESVGSGSDVSDSESGVHFEIYFTGTGDDCTLRCAVQFPKDG